MKSLFPGLFFLMLILPAFAGEDPIGLYLLDRTSMEKDALEQVRTEFEKTLEGQSEEAKKASRQQWVMMESQVKQMLSDMTISLRIEKNGNFSVDGKAGTETMASKGTWKQEGQKIHFTTLETNGKTEENPETIVATLENGALRMKPDQLNSFEFVMIKQK